LKHDVSCCRDDVLKRSGRFLPVNFQQDSAVSEHIFNPDATFKFRAVIPNVMAATRKWRRSLMQQFSEK
jgi:hypothetical protein